MKKEEKLLLPQLQGNFQIYIEYCISKTGQIRAVFYGKIERNRKKRLLLDTILDLIHG